MNLHEWNRSPDTRGGLCFLTPPPHEEVGYLFTAAEMSPAAKCLFLHLCAFFPLERACPCVIPEGGLAAGAGDSVTTSQGNLAGLAQHPSAPLPACPDFCPGLQPHGQVFAGTHAGPLDYITMLLPFSLSRGPPENGSASRGSMGNNVFVPVSIYFNCLRRARGVW